MLGNLVLLLTSVKLSSSLPEEEVMEVEYAAILPEELEEDIAMRLVPAPEIQTHSAYNEAQEFIEAQENNREEAPPLLDPSNEEVPESKEENIAADFNSQDTAIRDAKEKLKALKKKLSDHATPLASNQGSNRKTTISYHLTNRTARELPNPVYTCESGGKIVIDIEVSSYGTVKKATYNEAASTTTNGCLIDSALSYAKEARFSSDSSKKEQKGTISYSFPGQY